MPVEEMQSVDEESNSESEDKFKGIEDLEKHKIAKEEKDKSDYESEYRDDADPSEGKDAERQEEEEEDDAEQLQVTEDQMLDIAENIFNMIAHCL